jgi:hypothetical protein
MFTGKIYAPLPTGYFVDIFGKKHLVTFKVAAFLTVWSLLFANASTQLHISRVIEGLGPGIAVYVCPYIYKSIYKGIYIYDIFEGNARGILDILFQN